VPDLLQNFFTGFVVIILFKRDKIFSLCFFVDNPAILERMLDAGINYIDTAESYGNEPLVGSVIKKRDRKSVFISTKLQVEKDLSKEGFLTRARKCLERLQTDYIDCLMMHCPEKVEILKTEGFHA
jgi:diketogulonate reductase-like aldo/keto reductase